GLHENPHIYVTTLDGESYHRITDDHFDCSIYNSVNSDCKYGGSRGIFVSGDYLYFTKTEGHHSYINRIDINGNREKLTADNGTIDGFDVFQDRLYFTGHRGLDLQELYTFANNEAIKVTSFNKW